MAIPIQLPPSGTRAASPFARGFALVVTMVMMALVITLVMALLSLAVATTAQQSAIRDSLVARSNARLALAMALSDLQKYAGPDQRITATADMGGDTGGERLPDGKPPVNKQSLDNVPKGLTAVQPGTRYWTGVWTNSRPADEIYTKNPSPTLVQWLVSGNGGKKAMPAVTPDSPTVGLKGGGSAGADTAVLVGKGTVGPPSSPDNLDRYVTAPIIRISPPAGTSGQATGRFAWWVGDEGVKSRINLRPSDGVNTVATYQQLVAQRRGWEVVDGFQNYPSYGAPQSSLLDRIVTLPEAAAMDPNLAAQTGGASTLQSVFHSATEESRGVIADTLRGGLKLDLSAYLHELTSKPVPGIPNSPMPGGNIIPKVAGTDYSPKLGPKWDRLKTWHDVGRAAAAGSLEVRASSGPNDITVAPIILDFRMLLGARLVSVSDTSYRVLPCGKVSIALANPYPVPLEWKQSLELTIVNDTPQSGSYYCSCVFNAAGKPAFFDINKQPAVFFNTTFRISPDSIPPGEARAYTMTAPYYRPYDTNPITVGMGTFGSSDPSNFVNSIQLDHASVNTAASATSQLGLDVRESWTTTQISPELRLAGSSNILRRLDWFELDNGYFSETTRYVSPDLAKTMIAPFPLKLYSYQVSQPGGDYATVLPSYSMMGTRSSTLRSYTDFNLQAEHFVKHITSYNPAPYYMETSDSLSLLPFNPPGGDTGIGFTRNLAVSPLSWGRSVGFGPKKTVLFSPPSTLVSLAQFQHYDLTSDDFFRSVSQQPGNAVGNSYATPFVKRNVVSQARDNYMVSCYNSMDINVSSTHVTSNYYDLSYLLNAALFDTYFVSSIPSSMGTGAAQPVNRKIVKIDPGDMSAELRDGLRAAGRLMIDGAFNVNSTDKNAWKALLAANKKLQHPAGGDPAGSLVPRSLEQLSASRTPPSGVEDDSFAGYRRLTDEQIDALATEIVRQVRLRGPFVSYSQFVNRTLVDLKKDPALGRSGALQSALDNSGINISIDGKKNGFSGIDPTVDRVTLLADNGYPMADLLSANSGSNQGNGTRGSLYGGTESDGSPVWANLSRDLNPGAMASIQAERTMLTDSNYRNEQGFRSTGIPGWITQADLLQVLGPSLATRSDTFRIRTYGEAVSPANGRVTARAWCEALVQRMPDYLAADQNAAADRGTTLSPLNQLFGREFRIISFRWLSPDEI